MKQLSLKKIYTEKNDSYMITKISYVGKHDIYKEKITLVDLGLN